MFESIVNWIISNKDSLISNVIVSSLFLGFSKLWILKNNIPKALKVLLNTKYAKYFSFVILYVLPILTIFSMIIDESIKQNFKNIALFIILCITLVFNILMNHIISIYRMISELTSKSSYNDSTHKKAINIIFESIGRNERIE